MNNPRHSIRSPLILLLAVLAFGVSIEANANGATISTNPWLVDQIDATLTLPTDEKAKAELQSVKAAQKSVTAAQESNVRYWAPGSANYRWNQILLNHYAKGPPSPGKGRGVALLNVAIYDAITHARTAKNQFTRERPTGVVAMMTTDTDSSFPSSYAAASAAASEILKYLLPDEAAQFNDAAELSYQARVLAGANYPSDIEAGKLIGLKVAEKVVEFANSDGFDSKFTGERPTGPGTLQGELFVYPMAGNWKTLAVKNVEDYLPPAPPAYDSEEMAKELKVLREIDRNVPNSIKAWTGHSTYGAYQAWYERLAISVFENNLDSLSAAHMYATVAAANYDAIIACFKAKYEYWQIRPEQLDPELNNLFPSPPHPSYPSAHSCSSTSYAEAASHFFPERAEEFKAIGEAGGNSRLIAGIHYPSDDTAGDAVGKGVTAEVLQWAEALLQ